MIQRVNEHGFPIGDAVVAWQTRPAPPTTPMVGRLCRVEPLDPDTHAADLHLANLADTDGANWSYLGYGPFATLADYRAWMEHTCLTADPMFHAIVDIGNNSAIGVASLMRINEAMGVIEVGHINYSPVLQQSTAATEAMFLMMCRVFDELGYRRFEWKCDVLNKPSCRAARRLGFSYEGVFRQAIVYRQRNRDTAWYAIIDADWPAIRQAFTHWLAPTNFDDSGRQLTSLRQLMPANLSAGPPADPSY